MAITIPFKAQPHRIDYHGNDPYWKSLSSAIDQMFAELYADLKVLAANAATATTTTSTGITSKSTSTTVVPGFESAEGDESVIVHPPGQIPGQSPLLYLYNYAKTAGWGVPAVYGFGRQTAQVAAVTTVAAYTVGAADGSFDVSANVNVTTSTNHSFTVTVTYTDETNVSRTLTLTFSQLNGTLITAITNTTGAGPYSAISTRIRCKAATSITIATTGTFTTVTYNVEGSIIQVA